LTRYGRSRPLSYSLSIIVPKSMPFVQKRAIRGDLALSRRLAAY
jgi:hypothetical protein